MQLPMLRVRATSEFCFTSAGRPAASEEEGEDVAHLPLRVPTLLVLTSDPTNSQSRRKSLPGDPQPALLLLSPSSTAAATDTPPPHPTPAPL